MTNTKNRYLSKTVRSQIIAVIALALSTTGVLDMGEEIQWQIVDQIMVVVWLVAQVMAIYGRIVAKKQLK